MRHVIDVPISLNSYCLVMFKVDRILEKLFQNYVRGTWCSALSIYCYFWDSSGLLFSKQKLNVLAFASLIALRCILLHWKSPKPPSELSWQTDLMLFLKLEKIKFSLRGSTDEFYTTWKPFLTYFDKTPTVSVS